MRAAARQILDHFDDDVARDLAPAPEEKVNALEAPIGTGPEYIPDCWTFTHISKRIVEAFETLEKSPPLRGPRVPGNSWVPYIYDRADLNSQAQISEREKASRRRAQNRTVLRPTAEDLRRLDVVLDWLSELYAADADLCEALQIYASIRASDHGSVKEWCRNAGRSHQSIYRLRDRALAHIADRLRPAPVW